MERRAHPILSQIPLIISPSLQPPQAVTLPFSFNRLPSQVPQSAVSEETLERIRNDSNQFIKVLNERTKYRKESYEEWIDKVRKAEIEEKRRIAPGYLDTSNRILEPTRTGSSAEPTGEKAEQMPQREGSQTSELDQVFGNVKLN